MNNVLILIIFTTLLLGKLLLKESKMPLLKRTFREFIEEEEKKYFFELQRRNLFERKPDYKIAKGCRSQHSVSILVDVDASILSTKEERNKFQKYSVKYSVILMSLEFSVDFAIDVLKINGNYSDLCLINCKTICERSRAFMLNDKKCCIR